MHSHAPRRYVQSGPPVPPAPLPRPEWQGDTYVEADGTELEVTASGQMPSQPWPQGSRSTLMANATLHLRHGR